MEQKKNNIINNFHCKYWKKLFIDWFATHNCHFSHGDIEILLFDPETGVYGVLPAIKNDISDCMELLSNKFYWDQCRLQGSFILFNLSENDEDEDEDIISILPEAWKTITIEDFNKEYPKHLKLIVNPN